MRDSYPSPFQSLIFFFTFSGDIEMWHWTRMGWYYTSETQREARKSKKIIFAAFVLYRKKWMA